MDGSIQKEELNPQVIPPEVPHKIQGQSKTNPEIINQVPVVLPTTPELSPEDIKKEEERKERAKNYQLRTGVLPKDKDPVLALKSSVDTVNMGGYSHQSKRCKICNCEERIRLETERMYINKKTIVEIKTYLDSENIHLSEQIIHYHFKEHFLSQLKELRLQEYTDNLYTVLANRKDCMADLEIIRAACQLELIEAASMPTDNPQQQSDRRKALAEAKKTWMQAIGVYNDINKIDEKEKAIENRMIASWRKTIEEAPTEAEKEAALAALKIFKKDFKDLGK